jgi:hypothetical protein
MVGRAAKIEAAAPHGSRDIEIVAQKRGTNYVTTTSETNH